MCLKTIKISKTLDETANTQCVLKYFAFLKSQLIYLDITSHKLTFSAVYERFLSTFRQKPVSHDPTDRLFGLGIVFFAIVHRVFLSFKRSDRFKRSYRFFGAFRTIGSFKLNDPIV